MGFPSISIITVVRNAEHVLNDSLQSMASQSVGLEHIIIDGASTDGTLTAVNKYSRGENQRYDRIVKVFSENDQGIYDAMNKGIQRARASVVGILNAGDFYPACNVLANVIEKLQQTNAELLYGDLEYVNANNTSRVVRKWHSGNFSTRRFYWGWMPPHPTVFITKQCYIKNGFFNLQLGTAADYELMLRFMVKCGVKTTYLPEVLVKMRAGGISNASLKNRFRANMMDRKAWKVNGMKPYPWTLDLKPLRKLNQFLHIHRA